MKLRSLIFVFLFVFNINNIDAQVQIIQQPANPYSFSCEEVWNLNLVSPYTQDLHAKGKAVIKSSDGKIVAELKSEEFIVSPGANTLSSISLATVKKTYFNKDIQEIEEITGSLPAGSYKLCIQFSCAKPDCNGIEGEPFGYETFECIDLVLNPPTPLILAYPENEAKLKLTRPALTWIPPMPIAMSSNLTYTLTLSEMRKGQSRLDAIKRNRPLIFQEGISSTTLAYPLDIEELEKGKHYSWQVEAWVGRTKVGTSEVWEFEIEEDSFDYKVVPKNQSFIDIKNEKGQSQFYAVGKIKLKYKSRFLQGKFTYSIKNEDGKELDAGELEILPGENRYEIELHEVFNIKNLMNYQIHLVDPNGLHYTIKIKYIDPQLLNDGEYEKE